MPHHSRHAGHHAAHGHGDIHRRVCSSHAAGRPRMSQAANGVQTWYQYTASSLHGALYSVTTETRVEGAPVAGQSTRSVEYISAEGNVHRSESYQLLTSGMWALTSGESHQYDAQNRRIATLHDNGRSRSCGYICTGELLWEVDEDGVRTDYGYDASRRLVETIRSEVRDGETVITPETITTYTRDAAGRVLTTRRDVGPMTTTESMVYDILGRVTSRTDSLGRITSTAYSEDGLTTTLTTPAGATLITTRNRDGSVAHLAGTGQRELYYVYDLNGNNARETVKPADNTTILSQTITTDFGQVVAQAQPNANGGFIYSRSEYNAKGQLTKQYQDTGWNTAKTAATLYEYDAFGNVVKQTLALTSSPTPQNSPVTEMAYGAEELTDGIYRTVTRTRYNAEGNPLVSVQKSLVSNLSDALESKNLTIDERNLTSTQWVEYHNGTKRKSYNTLPTSNITAEAVTVDGFTLSQTDNAGVTTTNTRSYTANGMIHSRTDGRGNTTTTVTDIAGRTLTVTDAQGNISCYRYLYRGYLQIDSGAPLCAFTLSGQTLRVCPTGLTAVVRFACCDLTRSNHPCLWLITWDPTQSIATRPLAIQKDATWYTYGWDLTKNICEFCGSNGYIRITYSCTLYGEVTESANGVYQPIQWSSEYNDTELGMVYYNYRHYNQIDGKWVTRDPVPIKTNTRQYTYVNNSSIMSFDVRGLYISLSDYSISSCEFSHLKKCPKGARKRQKGYYEVDMPGYHCSGKQYEYRTNTPKKNYTPSVNGCGGKDGIKFPENFLLYNIKEACNIHDRCYGTCGEDRLKCDAGLLWDIYTICIKEGGVLLHAHCLQIAYAYSGVVLIAGNEFYEEGQDEGCEWQPCVE